MTRQEAKFLLSAYRPDGRDADDPRFAEALALAAEDPVLRAWHDHERSLDAACIAKLGEIAPPAGLRDAILAGARASRPRKRWWSSPVWLAVAAAIAVMAVVGISLRRAPEREVKLAALAEFGLTDYLQAHDDHEGHPPALADVQARLVSAALPLPRLLQLDFSELRARGCRTVRLGRAEVFEVCFYRDGVWYHLYATPRGYFAPSSTSPVDSILGRGEAMVASWTDANGAYALVTSAGAGALRRLL